MHKSFHFCLVYFSVVFFLCLASQHSSSRLVEPKGAVDASVLPDMMWTEPSDIATRNLLVGIGGEKGMPNSSNRFVVVKVPGNNSDEMIVDEEGTGRRWSITTGSKAKAEVAASRLVWAVGYLVDHNYFLSRLQVIDGSKSRTLDAVRLKRLSPNFVPLGSWQWRSNPFVGTQELQSLKVLMAVLNNGELGDKNNTVGRLVDLDQRLFYVGSLTSTLGKTARISGTAGNPKDYANQRLIDKVEMGVIDFHSKANNSSILEGIRVHETRHIIRLLKKLSDVQLQQAFKAGGFNDSEVATYIVALKQRISELEQIAQ